MKVERPSEVRGTDLLRLDHVVIAVADLERAVGLCSHAGFTVVPGGRHPGRNTRNALIVFEDGAYLELITYTVPSPDERSTSALLLWIFVLALLATSLGMFIAVLNKYLL